MAGKTEIEWCDSTWNPIRGCSRVSEGCRHCYAEALAARFAAPGQPYAGLAEMRQERGGGRQGHWTGTVRFAPNVLLDPIKWKCPQTIFVNSMSDLFHEAVMTDWIDQIMAVIALYPRHVFIVLTKRADVMRRYFSDPAWINRVRHCLLLPEKLSPLDLAACGPKPRVMGEQLVAAAQALGDGPLPNLWLGTSVENQPAADERIPELLATPAAKRLISYEPALGPINCAPWLSTPTQWEEALRAAADQNFLRGTEERDAMTTIMAARGTDAKTRLDWVICGGESGLGARPMHPDWARDVRDQCQAAGVPFFFKQWGAWANAGMAGAESANDNHPPHVWPDGTLMKLTGKKKAGHLLDGRSWTETPPMPRIPSKTGRAA